MIPGYAGKTLFVNLSSGESREELLDPAVTEKFLGGLGVNNWLAYRHIPPEVEPLSPENGIVIGTGPFSGTIVPGSAKLVITTKFPINGAFATASGGGAFPLRLKSCGYDHVVITGKAERPVYLLLTDAGPEIRDAAALWGMDNSETVDALHDIHQPCSVVPIGPAGENLVALSICVMDKLGTIGRGGLAAVMGSKNLKALVAVQGKFGVAVAHRRRFVKLANTLHERIMKWPGRSDLMQKGLIEAGYTAHSTYAPHTTTPPGMDEEFVSRRQRLSCPSCPQGEKSRICLTDGDYPGIEAYMPHFWKENFGGEGRIAHDRAIKYSDTLNRLGLCHMNFTHLFLYACHLYKEGLIDSGQTGGVALVPDLETALHMAESTAYRRGLGAIFADGLVKTGEHFGDAALAQLGHVKGQALIWDARIKGVGTMEFSQITNPRGAHVAAGGSPSYVPNRPPAEFLRHGERMGADAELLKQAVDDDGFNPGIYTKFSDDWFALFSSTGQCNRAFLNRFFNAETFAELYHALTGREVDASDMMKAAARGFDLGRYLNSRIGFGRKDDSPPVTWFKPLKLEGKSYHLTNYHGNKSLGPEHIERYLDDYYRVRGYDPDTGVPSNALLAEMGIPPGS